MSNWNLLSMHGLVLLSMADNPDVTTREMAKDLGVAERSVQRAVSDLDSVGYIKRKKVGRQNHYNVNRKKLLHALSSNISL
jgi:predicted transcriptional regulator